MKAAHLPLALQPLSCNSLVRMGKDFDGGYIIDSRNISSTDILIGLGMNDDWSFEDDFTRSHKIPTYIFDGTVSQSRFVKNSILSIMRIDKPSFLFHWLKTIIKYYFFFRNEKHHIKLLVDDLQGNNFISFNNLLEKYTIESSQKIFFKIDIEGSEYRLLDSLKKISHRISGMVIEFHNADLHLDKIIQFTNDFSLSLCHIHVNNYGCINQENIPLAIECTYSEEEFNDSYATSFPADIDMPNDPQNDDLKIIFS